MIKFPFKYLDLNIIETTKNTLPFVLEHEKSPKNSPYIGQWDKELHFSSIINKDYLHLIINHNDEPSGYLILSGINSKEKIIELIRIVITKKGQGLGRKTIQFVKFLAFENLNAHRLWLDVRMKNSLAKNLYLSEGFVQEGILRDSIMFENNYESIMILSILKNEYKVGV